jgi:hypothetical protein
MLDDKEVKKLSDAAEAAFKEQFEKWEYAVKRLDRSGQNARPDFLLSNNSGPQLICEVKTIISAGYLRDAVKGEFHISMRDRNLENLGVFENDLQPQKIDARLKVALRQRAALLADQPEYAELPLLVAFSFDFFADYMLFYPASFDERDKRFREVSGILWIQDGNAEKFVLLRNKAAIRPVPEDFARLCLPDRP